MPDKDAGTPRVFLLRHGETEWSISGRFTGSSDIPLTPRGEVQVSSSGRIMVGPGKIIDPTRLAKIFVSPRIRARRTYDILFDGTMRQELEAKTDITEDIREWEYGFYEGLFTAQIRAGRKERGFDKDRPWDIWRDGCEDGESPVEVASRVDIIIKRIWAIQGPYMHGEKGVDVVIIAHGHILKALTKRWIGFEMGVRLPMMMESGAVGLLSYEHRKVDEPALLLGVNMGAGQEAAKEQV